MAYSTKTSVTFKPTSVGTYSIGTKVKDGTGTEVRKFVTVTVSMDTNTLTNTSTISATSVALGKSVTMTGSCTGGSGTKLYAGWYKLSTDSSYTTIRDYSTTNTFTVTPKKAGTYSFVIRVKDGAGTNVRKEFSVRVNSSSLTNTSTISATSVALGKSVTMTGSCTGGSGTKLYAGWYKLSTDSSYTTIRDYSTTNTFTVTPKKTGTYSFVIRVKDSAGTNVRKEFSVTINSSTLTNTSTVSKTTIAKGSSIKVNCSSTGGTGTKKYAVWYKKSTQDSYTTVKDYSTSTTATVTPKGTGTYYIVVRVRDGSGKESRKQFTITVKAALANSSTVSKTTISKGNSVKVSLASTGGFGTKKYAVWYRKSTSSSWTQKQKYSTNTSVTVTPKYTGTYYISTKVKDADGNIVKKQFTVKVNAALANTSKVASTAIANGTGVKVTLASTGGVGTKKYAVWYKKSTASSWTQKQKYSTNTSVTVTPKHTGTYYISTKVKDANGTIVKKQFSIKVYSPLVNTSKVSSTGSTVGRSITVTCASTGGYGTKKYAVYSKYITSDTWTKIRDYSTGTSVTVTPSKLGTFTIRVKAKDGKGTIKNKDFTISSVAPLNNTSKLSAGTITLGSAVKVTCSSTGGTGTKTYAVYYKQTSQDSWTKARDYSTGTSVSITPKAATTYTVRVKAKDSSNNIVNKDLALKVEKADALKNTSTVSTTTVSSGGYVKITCSASNGTAPYYYKVEKMNTNDGSWTTVKDFADVSTVSVKCSSKGTWQIKVTVMDMAGKKAVKYLTVSAT